MNKLASITRSLALAYVREGVAMINRLRQSYQFENLLHAWRNGQIPTSGELPGDVRYRFHGCGCEFSSQSGTVDLDFGPDGRCDGFDAWRVFQFTKSQSNCEAVLSLEDLNEGVRILEECGEVAKFGGGPSPHLYHFLNK
jgi:hypothetical protein